MSCSPFPPGVTERIVIRGQDPGCPVAVVREIHFIDRLAGIINQLEIRLHGAGPTSEEIGHARVPAGECGSVGSDDKVCPRPQANRCICGENVADPLCKTPTREIDQIRPRIIQFDVAFTEVLRCGMVHHFVDDDASAKSRERNAEKEIKYDFVYNFHRGRNKALRSEIILYRPSGEPPPYLSSAKIQVVERALHKSCDSNSRTPEQTVHQMGCVFLSNPDRRINRWATK